MMHESTPNERLMRSTYEISRIMRQRMLSDCRMEEGANFLHMHALMIIGAKPDITMKELAQSLHITSPSATSLVHKLVTMGWVERKHDEKNRKLVRLAVSAAGATLLQGRQKKMSSAIYDLFGLLTPQEQETLATLHEKILHLHQHRQQR